VICKAPLLRAGSWINCCLGKGIDSFKELMNSERLLEIVFRLSTDEKAQEEFPKNNIGSLE
jgi:hypothetical protein